MARGSCRSSKTYKSCANRRGSSRFQKKHGTRIEVYEGIAKMTKGGNLMKKDLVKNPKTGKIVSKKKREFALKNKIINNIKEFQYVKGGGRKGSTRSRRSSRCR